MTEPKTKSLTSRAITVQLNVKKIFIPALIAVALVATGLFFLLKTGSGNFSNQVVVVEYINRTGDPNFDSVGRQAAQEVSQGLESLGLFGVAPLTRFELGSNNSLGEKDYIQIAQSADAAIVVTGELYFKGTDLEIRSKLYDARKKKLIPSPGAVSGPPGEYEIFKELSDRLKSAVLGTHDPLAEMWQKISPYIPRYEALLEFQRGIKLYLSNEYKSAAAYFNRAVDIDRDYLLAYLNAFWAHREARNNPAAEQYAKKIEKFANLSPGEKFIVARKEELSIRMKMTRVWAFDVAQKFEDA